MGIEIGQNNALCACDYRDELKFSLYMSFYLHNFGMILKY